MDKRTIAGTPVGALGLGCMGMSQAYSPPYDNESLGVLERAIELGCNSWDTADVYGACWNGIMTPSPHFLPKSERTFDNNPLPVRGEHAVSWVLPDLVDAKNVAIEYTK